jgi:beta-glucosidase
VLVLVNGRPVSLEWIAEAVPVIVEAWFPSEEGAGAIADVLFGVANPGGKLPITFPRTVGQVPIFYGHRPSGGRSHWKENYVETSVKPLYPFGFGLSYTQFEFSDMRIDAASARSGEAVTIQVDVTNIGDRAGDEVVQLYIHQVVPFVTRPLKELKGFKRVTLEPGQKQTVTFELSVNQLGFYDRDYQFIVQPGTVEVMVGNSSQDIHCKGSFEIAGDQPTPVQEKVFFSRVHVS